MATRCCRAALVDDAIAMATPPMVTPVTPSTDSATTAWGRLRVHSVSSVRRVITDLQWIMTAKVG